ncbi:hypothetical protein [Collimonas fungivorans]|uniref:hypothetical protein n=1 Tax=Collimonas fungivorans TaxID=158899 RepID=UPI00142889FA|nr:hypothetical protein [Collimonas fungivorans]
MQAALNEIRCHRLAATTSFFLLQLLCQTKTQGKRLIYWKNIFGSGCRLFVGLTEN